MSSPFVNIVSYEALQKIYHIDIQLGCVQLGTKMSWLDFEVKKVRGQGHTESDETKYGFKKSLVKIHLFKNAPFQQTILIGSFSLKSVYGSSL